MQSSHTRTFLHPHKLYNATYQTTHMVLPIVQNCAHVHIILCLVPAIASTVTTYDVNSYCRSYKISYKNLSHLTGKEDVPISSSTSHIHPHKTLKRVFFMEYDDCFNVILCVRQHLTHS